jgi:hypothetical protein
MSQREQIEAKIKEVFTSEQSATRLSNRLFSESGLFMQLAMTTQDSLAEIAKSELWQAARQRVGELQQIEEEVLCEAAEFIRKRLPYANYRIRFEPIDASSEETRLG